MTRGALAGEWLDIGWVDEIPLRGSRTVPPSISGTPQRRQ